MGGGASASTKYENSKTAPDSNIATSQPKNTGGAGERGTSCSGPTAAQIFHFLEKTHDDERAVVEDLLSRVAVACGGDPYFYSAPDGMGRKIKHRGDTPRDEEDRRTKFFLVASTVSGAKPNQAAPKAHQSTLDIALKQGYGKRGRSIASCVVISGTVEGVLLIDKSKPDCNTDCELWALLLAERLEKVRLTTDAQNAIESMESVRMCLERFLAHQQHATGLMDLAAGMIPRKVLDGFVNSDQPGHLWFLDHDELVLNDDGQLDAVKVPLDQSVVGDVVSSGEEFPVFIDDVKKERKYNRVLDAKTGFETTQFLCVPFAHPSLSTRAVMQFRNGTSPEMRNARERPHCIDHFDKVGAERIQQSILPNLLWCRDAFLTILFRERQREALQATVAELNLAVDVYSVIQIVQQHVGGVMNCERCTLFFVDQLGEQIWAPASAEAPQGIRMQIGAGLVGHVAQLAVESYREQRLSHGTDSRKLRRAGSLSLCPVGAIRTNDPKNDPHWGGDVDESFTTRNLITVPVWSSGKDKNLIGIIQVLNKGIVTQMRHSASSINASINASCATVSESTFWTERDAQLLEVISEAVGDHLQRLMLDMMWSKANFDAGAENTDSKSIIQEFYGGGSFGQLNSNQAKQQLTVHRDHCTTSDIEPLPTAHRQSLAAAALAGAAAAMQELEQLSESWEAPPHADVQSWEIDYWKLSQKDEFNLLLGALRYCDAIAPFTMSLQVMHNFFSEVRANYEKVPYHSFHHAMSTVHYTFRMMQAAGVFEVLDRKDMFAAIWGALCHDVGHRGRNNAFEVMTRSELALRYNDSSPLENHHCAKAFEIAFLTGSTDCNIFQGMDGQTYKEIRKQMVAGILSTDMQHHVDHVNLMQAFRLEHESTAGQSQFLVEVFIHSADISNVMMPQEVAAKFTLALSEEFSLQADAERGLGLPVTTFMDGLRDPVKAAKSTMGFIDFVVQPLMEPMFRTFSLPELKENLIMNRKAFEEICHEKGAVSRLNSLNSA